MRDSHKVHAQRNQSVLRRLLAAWIPDYQAATVFDIDFVQLQKAGIRCIAVDIDNTIVTHGGMQLTPETIALFRRHREEGSIEKLALATNRSGSRIGDLAAAMHADVIVHAQGMRRKPSARYYRLLLSLLGCRAREAAMIGDKVVQDVFGGNRAGLTTVLVEPLGPARWFQRRMNRWARAYGIALNAGNVHDATRATAADAPNATR